MTKIVQQKSGSVSRLLIITSYIVIAAALLSLTYIEFHGISWNDFPYNSRDSVFLGRDFLNSYNMSLFAWSGNLAEHYDPHRYLAFLTQVYGSDLSIHLLSYPPSLAVLVWPLSWLPYCAALLIWTAGGIAALALALRLTKLGYKSWLALIMPATAMCIIAGQIGLYVAALLIAGFFLRQTRPVISGILFGLLTIKPQLGLLIPFLLLYERNWRAIFSATLTTLLLFGASIGLVGFAAWQSYIEFVPATQHAVLTEWSGVMLSLMPTAYINARLVGLGDSAAMVQAASLIIASLLFIWALAKKIDGEWLFFALCITTTAISPYFFTYDLIALGVAALVLIDRDQACSPLEALVVSLALIFPVITFALATAKLPLSAILLLSMLAFCIFRKKGAAPAPFDTLMNNSRAITIP